MKKGQKKINEQKDKAQNTGWDGEQQLEEQQQRDEGPEMKRKDELIIRRLIIWRRNWIEINKEKAEICKVQTIK